MLIFEAYLLIINAAAFILMHVDKQKAIHNKWRIPEATLLAAAIFGGSIGLWLGMYVFTHKIRKKKFFIGTPAILIAQLAIACIFL